MKKLFVYTLSLINYKMAEGALSLEETSELLRVLGPHNRTIQDLLTEAKDLFAVKEFMYCKSIQAMLAAGVGQDYLSFSTGVNEWLR